ncbi:Shwachman-Bodian-Diamond syndrome protein [Naegleria gruberi]|uniref:Shwachman-Bodian-Diamond syndrome protein n=1 Tax=Naegleria gruberi TaxID=5762 RepID=D2VKH8_NAEGR|nr:Shwachman-Bodian-Diamond syndrome protein [Naegleria gruberi]EFC42692.1 Shwachman-Bodian-Diamond syndrome protein [Naegleria gruberi]|eukprot:XP_002675436.1 Shwachman-Bodian-Diamond syndrome protein [Naegleria gruberi strain NEG-M]
MSRAVKTPVNQILHTNVAVVRMKIQKAVFEIACYKNSVVSWRKGIEKDLSEVVQIDTVFTNVSKGEAAKKTDLQKYFGTSDTKEVCKKILQDGELQVSTKEREEMYESMFKDIVTIITNKCINPDTQRPYPGGVIERALKEQIHFSVKPSKSTKQQALEAISKLKRKIPIEKAHMRVKLTLSGKENIKKLRQLFKTANKEEEQVKFEQDDYSPETETANIICRIDPGLYRHIFDIVDEEDGEVQVLDTTVSEEGDTTIDELDDKQDESEKKPIHHSTVENSDNEEEEETSKKSKKKSEDSKKKPTKKNKKSNKNESDDEKPEKTTTTKDESDEEQLISSSNKKQSKKEKKKAKKKQTQQDDSDDEAAATIEDDEEEEKPKKTAAKKAPTSNKKASSHSDEDQEPSSNVNNDSDEELVQTSSNKKQSKKEKKKAKKFAKQSSTSTQEDDEQDDE